MRHEVVISKGVFWHVRWGYQNSVGTCFAEHDYLDAFEFAVSAADGATIRVRRG